MKRPDIDDCPDYMDYSIKLDDYIDHLLNEKRDQFAAAALTGILSHSGYDAQTSGNYNIKFHIPASFKIADAMMQAREGGNYE